jgi:soluble lytic murein transglycosylase-like protein
MALAELLCAAVISIGMPRPEVACQHMETVVEASEAEGVDPYVMLGLIHIESRWSVTAHSSSNACGLTQIVPKWTGSRRTGVPKLTCKELFVPTKSIRMGARTFSFWLTDYAKGDYKVALCGYNKGYRCKGDTPHPTGMRYASRVLRKAQQLRTAVARIEEDSCP